MAALKRLLVRLVAALAGPRAAPQTGIDAYVPAMIVLGALLAMPVFALLLTVVRVATRHHRLLREPLLRA